jgi:hypothetical protein
MGVNGRLVWLMHWTKRVQTRVQAVLVVRAKKRIIFAYIYVLRKGWSSTGTARVDVVRLSL